MQAAEIEITQNENDYNSTFIPPKQHFESSLLNLLNKQIVSKTDIENLAIILEQQLIPLAQSVIDAHPDPFAEFAVNGFFVFVHRQLGSYLNLMKDPYMMLDARRRLDLVNYLHEYLKKIDEEARNINNPMAATS